MGWWSGVWEGIKRCGSVVSSIARKAWEFASGPTAKSAYDQLERILETHRNSNQVAHSTGQVEPDFFGGLTANQVVKKVEDYERDLAKQRDDLEHAKRYMAVQTEFSRLRGSAELIDRSMANIKIHAASLSTHFQNMRNINGLVEDVNALRGGLYTIMKTFNHNLNILGAQSEESKLVKIEGVDIDMKEGAISQVAAFDAFDRTRQLLADEIINLAQLAKSHGSALENLKVNAATLGGEVGYQVGSFIDSKIKPIISNAESSSYLLQEELRSLPVAARDSSGKIIFEDGKMKVENDIIEHKK